MVHDLQQVVVPTQSYCNRDHRNGGKWEDWVQKGFKNGKCTHCKEKVPVGAIFGLVFLKRANVLVNVLEKVFSQLAHWVVGQLYNYQS